MHTWFEVHTLTIDSAPIWIWIWYYLVIWLLWGLSCIRNNLKQIATIWHGYWDDNFSHNLIDCAKFMMMSSLLKQAQKKCGWLWLFYSMHSNTRGSVTYSYIFTKTCHTFICTGQCLTTDVSHTSICVRWCQQVIHASSDYVSPFGPCLTGVIILEELYVLQKFGTDKNIGIIGRNKPSIGLNPSLHHKTFFIKLSQWNIWRKF